MLTLPPGPTCIVAFAEVFVLHPLNVYPFRFDVPKSIFAFVVVPS